LVGTVVLEFRYGVASTAMKFPEAADNTSFKEDKGRDLVVCFNIILLYVQVSIGKRVIS
jgi:hypothetical protein